jgi:FkbM family methyltransferase
MMLENHETRIKPITSGMDFKKNKKIYVYGAGSSGRILHRIMKNESAPEVSGFLDSNRHGSVLGFPLISIDQLHNHCDDPFIVIASENEDEIIEICHAHGFHDLASSNWIRSFYSTGSEWNLIFSFYKAHAPENGVVFDIGANKAPVSMRFSPHASRVLSFEPNPYLKSTFLFNTSHLKNIEFHQIAFSNKRGNHDFYIDSVTTGGSSLAFASDIHDTAPVKVDVRTVDDFCEEYGVVPDFIKIDAEGFDQYVMRGGLKTISSVKPSLIFEFAPGSWYDGFSEIFEELSKIYNMTVLGMDIDAAEYYFSEADHYWKMPPDSRARLYRQNIACFAK